MYQFIKSYGVALFVPTALIGLSLLIAVFTFRRRPQVAKWSGLVGVTLLFLFGLNPVSEALLAFYEGLYPGLEVTTLSQENRLGLRHIVVLAGGYTPAEHQPLTSHLGTATLARVVEGVRLWHGLEHTQLVFSGAGWEKLTEAEAMAALAIQLGVPKDKIVLEKASRNTFDHTRYLEPIVGQNPFILVTSALHMPRAMAMFSRAGLKAIPAPTGHVLTGNYQLFNNKPPYPRGDNLKAMDELFLEWVGMLWGRLKGEL